MSPSRRDELARARDALRAISPDLSREDWIRAGMAAKAAGLSLEDFDAWSATGATYNPRSAADAWRSFKPDGGIGAGTLFAMAREAGWTDRAGANGSARLPSHRKAVARRTPPFRGPRPGMNAVDVWGRCVPATCDHDYIASKDGIPDGLRVLPDGDPLHIAGESVAGWLVVPVLPLGSDQPVSLQFISPPGQGKKLNLPGAKVDGAFLVGDLQSHGTAYIVEGIGQAWACWKATGNAAVVAFGAGRMREVARELRERDSAARLVLVPDAGKEEQAWAIAAEVGALVAAMPDGSKKNFDANDYAKAKGHDALEVLLGNAKAPPLPEPPRPLWKVVQIDDLAAANIPPQSWVWDEYIPVGEVTLLGAHGGTGKSTIALMLAVSVALGRPLFGIATRLTRVVFYSAEDGADTVRRRLRSIALALGVDVAELSQHLEVLDASDQPELAVPPTDGIRGQSVGLSQVCLQLQEHMAERPGALLIVDNASDAFGGNENARPEVRAFVRLLAGMVRAKGGAVLLLAHVDKGTSRGERPGTESYSGSTAWHNSVRSRLFMSRDKEGDLLLEHQKSNHGLVRDPLRLRWPRDGVPMLDVPEGGVVSYIKQQSDAKSLLRLIHEFTVRGESVSTATNSRTHAGKLLRGQPGFPRRVSDAELFDLLRDAERCGHLERETYRKPDRHEGQRWRVTEAGLSAAGVRCTAATAATATTPGVAATSAVPAAPAATAATSPPGGVGETAPQEVTAGRGERERGERS